MLYTSYQRDVRALHIYRMTILSAADRISCKMYVIIIIIL